MRSEERKYACINARNKNGETPLSLAAQFRHPRCVRLLLQNGSLVDTVDHHSMSPAAHAASSGSFACMRELLNHNPSLLKGDAATPILLATFLSGSSKLLSFLINSCHFTKRGDSYLWGALCAAIQRGHMRCLEVICQSLGQNIIARQIL